MSSDALTRVLNAAFKVSASDIHLKVGVVPMYRMGGSLRPVECPPTQEADLLALAARLTGLTEHEINARREVEFSCDWGKEGRLRGHYYRQRGGPALALRTIPPAIPTFADLRLPPVAKQICAAMQGLVLVTGATGMGKSTTLAAMVAHIAQTSCRHVICLEDPIEYQIRGGVSSVAQREVGRDVESFAAGLHAALRQDPDVIFFGELRDRETLEVALHAALTGHLVLSSAHFTDAVATVEGILAMFESGGRSQGAWRHRLAQGLLATVSQRLLPRRDGGGVVLATEVLVNEPTIRACILDESRTRNIRNALAQGGGGGDYKTHTLDQSLMQLLEANQISFDTARAAAISPGEIARQANLKGLTR